MSPTIARAVGVVSLAILAFGQQAHALEPALQLTQFTQKAWHAGEDRYGLPQNSVFSIAQTPDGYLWLATQEGLVRFDGVRFTAFNSSNTKAITHNDVWKLLPSSTGLWIATRGGGLLRYSNGRFEHWSAENGLAGDVIHALWLDADGGLWVGTNFGLSHMTITSSGETQIQNYREDYGLTSNTVYSIFRDASGVLYVGTDSAGINVMNEDGRFDPFLQGAQLKQATTYNIHQDAQGTLWIATGNGLFRWDGSKLKSFGETDGLSSKSVRTIFEDSDHSLWLGTDGGLNRLVDGEFTAGAVLPGDQVGAIAEDAEGNLWVGTDGDGLHRLSNSKFVPYGVPEGLANDNARAVMQSKDGKLWIGTFAGIDVFDGKHFEHISKKQGLSGDIVLSLAEGADGSIWAGTLDGGLNRIKDGHITHFGQKEGLIGQSVMSLAEDREGTLWIGTRGNGLSRLHDGKIESFTMDTGLPNNSVRVIMQSRNGDVWLGTLGGGLVRYHDGKFQTLNEEQGLSNGRIFALHEDAQGALWIGTFGGGLNRYANGQFTQYTTADGLYDDSIFQILEDDSGYLWLTSNRGISRVSKKQLSDHSTGRIQRLEPTVFGQWDGLRNREANGGHQPAGWRTTDGKLWIPTIRGLGAIDPQHIATNSHPPPVVIESVLLDGRPADLAGPIIVDAGTKKLEFRFTALSFTDPDSVQFRHYLEGFDTDWVEAGEQRNAQFTNLPPGRYSFHVTAMNNDGLWNENGTELSLEKRAYIYQQPYFFLVYILAALLVAGGALQIHKRRLKQLKARQQELLDLVRQREEAADALKAANLTLRGQIENLASDEAEGGVREHSETSSSVPEILDDVASNDMDKIVGEFQTTLSTLSNKERQLKAARLALGNSKQQLEDYMHAIKRYVPEQLVQRIMSGRHVSHAQPDRKLITILYAEIGGFADAAERTGSEQSSGVMNEYLSELSRIADRYYATIAYIGGDTMMILFGAPDGAGVGVDAQGAVMMAVEMMQRSRELVTYFQGRELPDRPDLRIGIHTGHASVGDFGPDWRKWYTATGPATTLARRVQQQCRANSILLSDSTYQLVKDQVMALPLDDSRGKRRDDVSTLYVLQVSS